MDGVSAHPGGQSSGFMTPDSGDVSQVTVDTCGVSLSGNFEKNTAFETAHPVSEREITPVISGPEKKAFRHWAIASFEHVLEQEPYASPDRLLRIVKDIYHYHAPEFPVKPLTMVQLKQLIDRLVRQVEKHHLRTKVSGYSGLDGFRASLTETPGEIPNKQLICYSQKYVYQDKNSRLTLNVLPESLPEIVNMLVGLMCKPEWEIIKCIKIQNLKSLGTLTDTVIIYLVFNREAVNQLVELLKVMIPADFCIEHTPLAMERRSKGISYGESVMTRKNDSSFGYSRARLIATAIELCLEYPAIDFHRELDSQLFMAGYSPDNPARIADMTKSRQDLTWFIRNTISNHPKEDHYALCQSYFLQGFFRPPLSDAQAHAHDSVLQQMIHSKKKDVQPETCTSTEGQQQLKSIRVFPPLPLPPCPETSCYQLSICFSPEHIHECPKMLNGLLEKLKKQDIAAFYDVYAAHFVQLYGCTAHLFIPAPLAVVFANAREIEAEYGEALLQGSDMPACCKIADGLFYGEVEHANDRFAKSRGEAVYAAIKKAESKGYLAERIEECFREAGIDPGYPEKLLPR